MVTNDGDVVDLDEEIAQVIADQGLRGDSVKVIRDFVYIRDYNFTSYRNVLYHVRTKQIYDRSEGTCDIYDIRDHRMIYTCYENRYVMAYVEDMKTNKVIDKTEVGYPALFGDICYVNYVRYYHTLYNMNCPRSQIDSRKYSWLRQRACPWRDPSVYNELSVYEKMYFEGTMGTIDVFKKMLEIVRYNSDHHLLSYIPCICNNSTRNISPNDEFIAFQKKDLSIEVIYIGEEKDDGLCKGALN